jgi:hypothetical protein
MDPAKLLLDSLGGPIRIALLSIFLLLAKAGWFTWLTPESAHQIVNAIMDALVVLVPAAYAIWAGFKTFRRKLAEARENQPEVIVAKAAALPEVGKIVVTPDIAAKVDDPSVTTRG